LLYHSLCRTGVPLRLLSSWGIGLCSTGFEEFSILLVLIHHAEFITPITFSILPGGFLGVDIFFVLRAF